MNNIHLTSSMRSNLLSLTQTAKLQSLSEKRLSTGLKVNSAIDNTSSYYVASSLNNRASDLSTLLDSMAMGIQTIKTAQLALNQATKFLEQANAVANQAFEIAPIDLGKDWFVAEAAKKGGVVVSSVAELEQAIVDNKALIVVYGKIDYKQNEGITLKTNQKLVGTEYFADINSNASYRGADGKRISELNFDINGTYGIRLANNTVVSDLSINYTTQHANTSQAILARDVNYASLKNLDIVTNVINTITSGAVISIGKSNVDFYGEINILTSGGNIPNYSSIQINDQSNVNFYGNINSKIASNNTYQISIYGQSTLNVYGNINVSGLNINQAYSVFLTGYNHHSGNTLNIKSSAKIWTDMKNVFNNGYVNGTKPANNIIIESGAELSIKKSATEINSFISKGYNFNEENLVRTFLDITALNADKAHFSKKAQGSLGPNFDEIFNPTSKKSVLAPYSSQFNSILSQYDTIIQDASYKGINLLLSQNLRINFNENRTSKLDINGVDASIKNLGLDIVEWESNEDINGSINQISEAINKIQDFISELGNNLEVMTTRENFTKNIINTLVEGADKLVLADMNEEAANMLSLQTRQQLAINALSLAAQSAQSILRLF